MSDKIQSFKRELSRVFDDDLHTKQWHNYVDYAIIGLIILSTLQVFLSTYDGIVEKYGLWLKIVDYFTTAFFTVEVSLRIWCADLIDDKYKGFWGRVRYCFSFYGLIDVLSTYPFYLHFFMPIPYVALKALRIARLMRVFRYMKAFGVLSRAMRAKKDEMWVSIQFLTIITLLLSFVLFFVEHEAQPDVYNNGWTSVLWAFAQYIGDPGGFADTPPITITGRIIACIIGVLGIAIFAVPAGLIGSAFSEVMEEDEKAEKDIANIAKLSAAFRHVQDRYTKYITVPRFVSVPDIQAKYRLAVPQICNTVNASHNFRVRNLASTVPVDSKPIDKLAIETFPLNTTYGCCIDRGSKVTIVATSNVSEATTGTFAYYLAKIGGFNYVSKEVELDMLNPVTYYNITDEHADANLPLFLSDINRLANADDHWVIFILAASGNMEPEYPTQFHYVIGKAKGDETYDDPRITIKDISSFDALYKDVTGSIEQQFGLLSDCQKYHAGTSPKNIARHIDCKNAFTIRIAWSVLCWDYRYLQIAQTMASCIRQHVAQGEPEPELSDLTSRVNGHDCGYYEKCELEDI